MLYRTMHGIITLHSGSSCKIPPESCRHLEPNRKTFIYIKLNGVTVQCLPVLNICLHLLKSHFDERSD